MRFEFHPYSLVAALLCRLSITCSCRAQEFAAKASYKVESVPATAGELPDAPLPNSIGIDLPEESKDVAPSPTAPAAPTLKGLPARFFRDELGVVTSPARIRKHDLLWLLPLAGASAASLATDTRAMRDVVSHDPGFDSSATTSSDVIRGIFIGGPVLLYGGGLLAKDEHARETGLLAGEAMVDAYVAGLAVKYVTLRERPSQNNGRGHFFSGDAASDPSFVSGHSIVVWSSAAVLAGEYSRPWQQAMIYTVATGGSLTRVLGQNHFPTDALLGSAAGWLIGHYVYRAHHRFAKR